MATSLSPRNTRVCGFCGSKENIESHSVVPDRCGAHRFCKDKDCYRNYVDFVYSGCKDLTYGVPTKSGKKAKSIELICAFCGNKGENVIFNPRLGVRYKHKTFCMNDICCQGYCKFVDQTLPLLKHRVPHIYNSDSPSKSFIELLDSSVSEAIKSDYDT
jgi:hypothetical protein